MFKQNKKFQLSDEELELHKDLIAKDLKLTKLPKILVGAEIDEAFPPKFFGLKKTGNYFCYINLPEGFEEYKDVGVITLRDRRKATLAHEMKHAKQFQNGHELMQGERSLFNKFRYFFFYPFYPTEKEAFKSALDYVEKNGTIENEKNPEYNQYKREFNRNRFIHIITFPLVLIFIILLVAVFIWYFIIH